MSGLQNVPIIVISPLGRKDEFIATFFFTRRRFSNEAQPSLKKSQPSDKKPMATNESHSPVCLNTIFITVFHKRVLFVVISLVIKPFVVSYVNLMLICSENEVKVFEFVLKTK